MNPTGDLGGGSEAKVSTDLAVAEEQLVRAIRAHADAVVSADEPAARAAKAAIRSAMSTYSVAIDDAWDQVGPFPLPQTWRERKGLAPREVFLRVTYHLQVLDRDRLMASAEDVSCEPVPDAAEAAAALYGARVWVPGQESGLAYVSAGYGGGFEQT